METTSAPNPSVGLVDGANILFRQSWLNQLPLVVTFVLLEGLMVYLSIVFGDKVSVPVAVGSKIFFASYLPAIPLFILARAALNVYNERLVATPQYLIHVTGRISWRERSVRLEYQHIQEIETIQSILQRILGVGDLVITPVGGSNRTSITMKGLRSPRAVKDVVRGLRNS